MENKKRIISCKSKEHWINVWSKFIDQTVTIFVSLSVQL